ncbi:MAG: hypothetical protein HY606_14185 [Planctomycetes bacterium]|nr:hypothetical protein [Planctomycetota bacterium]
MGNNYQNLLGITLEQGLKSIAAHKKISLTAVQNWLKNQGAVSKPDFKKLSDFPNLTATMQQLLAQLFFVGLANFTDPSGQKLVMTSLKMSSMIQQGQVRVRDYPDPDIFGATDPVTRRVYISSKFTDQTFLTANFDKLAAVTMHEAVHVSWISKTLATQFPWSETYAYSETVKMLQLFINLIQISDPNSPLLPLIKNMQASQKKGQIASSGLFESLTTFYTFDFYSGQNNFDILKQNLENAFNCSIAIDSVIISPPANQIPPFTVVIKYKVTFNTGSDTISSTVKFK